MNRRPHIVFVDDEPLILSGLRRMLHAQNERWDMTFAGDAAQALTTLQARPCDVIVSDYGMPGMDGATLLQTVRERYPTTARVILSGRTDEDNLLKGILVAHRFLDKPCQQEQIIDAVERVIGLSATLANDDVQRDTAMTDSLPSPPHVLLDLVAALNDEDASARTVGEVIAQDPATTAKILHLVNSSSFSLAHKINDVSQAVTLLGLRNVQALVMMHDLVRSFDTGAAVPADWIARMTTHAVESSRLSRHLAAGTPWADAAFVAGLLHEVGQLVLASSRPAMFAANLTGWHRDGQTLGEVETTAFGVAHPDVGAYLLDLWGLPSPVVEAVSAHATGAGEGAGEDGARWEPPQDLAATVALAHRIVEAELGAVCGRSDTTPTLDEADLDPTLYEAVQRWRRERARFAS